MAIIDFTTDFAGQVNVIPRLPRINCNDNLATVTSPNYLTTIVAEGFQIRANDIVCVSFQGGVGLFTATLGPNNFITLNPSSILSPQQLTVSTTTTLTASNFGETIIATGSSAYTITLPSPQSGKFLHFVFDTSSNALVTLSPPSGTISGQASLTYGSSEGCTLYCDGTNYIVTQQYLQPVNFRAYLFAGAFTVPTSAGTIVFDGVSFNIGNFYNSSTGAFTPLYPGKYKISFSAQCTNGSTAQSITCLLNKDGGDMYQSITPFLSNGVITIELSDILSMNGSTDNSVMQAFASTTNNATLNNNTDTTYFQGFRISNF